MFRKLLVATDGSELSRKAGEVAIGLARATWSEHGGFTAVDEYPYAGMGPVAATVYGELQAKAGAEANDRLAALEVAARAADVACETIVRQTAHAWRGVIEVAQEAGCDAIVMASHGRRGVKSLLLGSETMRVLTHSTLPVLVVR